MIQPTYNQQLGPQQTPQPGGANAVAINIYNPQAYGSTPASNQVNPYQNSLYQMPQDSVYNPQMASAYPAYQQYYVPQYDMSQQPVQYQLPEPPAPDVMPASVLDQNAPVQNNAQQEVPVEVTPVEQQPAKIIDTNSLIDGLKSEDVKTQEAAINKIAEYAQDSDPEVAQQVLSGPIFQGLIDEINKDTSALEGPSEEQLKIVEKLNNGEQLTPEEDAVFQQLSPRDAANMNRIFSLYTLAMLQRLQRDYQSEYNQSQIASGQQPEQELGLVDLAGIGDVVNVIKNDPRGEVRVAAIQALKHVVNPEDKAQVETIVNDAGILTSEDAGVKAAAEELMSAFAGSSQQEVA